MAMAWSWVRVSCLVLLFSGCLAAAVNKEIPDPDDEPRDINTAVLPLAKFNWKTDTPETLDSYTSLEVCLKDKLTTDGNEIFTIVYNDGGEQLTEYSSGKLVRPKNICVEFTAATIPLPSATAEITYELHISSDDGSGGITQKLGDATFSLDPATYLKEDVIECDKASYNRGTGVTSTDCDKAEGQYITGDICYKVAGGATTDAEGCMTANPGGTPEDELKVCLSDKASTAAKIDGTAFVTSLSYTATGASLEIGYSEGTAPLTNLEMIMQDIDDQTLFYARACPDGELSCDIDGYTKGAKTYQVCAVNAVDPDAITSTKPGDITDLDLAATQYGDKLEFGFNNARPVDGMYYSAGVDNAGSDGRTAKAVGINCNGVLADYTCYGFLDISGLTAGGLLLTVQYGELTGDDVTPAGLNTIIGTYTKTAL